MKTLPLARLENIIVQNVGKEVLIYDLNTHKAYNLNETSSVVYQSCDGKTSFDDLNRRYKFTDDLIYLALDELKKENLLESGYVSPFVAINRREVIRKVGLASMVALPLIVGITAPLAANAASVGLRANNESCTSGSQCASGVCTANSNFSLVCCAQTANSNLPLAPGGYFQSSSQSACTASAARFCCSGRAAYNSEGSGTCTCT